MPDSFEELQIVRELRHAAAVAYQFCAPRGANTDLLDNLSALSGGNPAPHKEWPIETGEWDWAECKHHAGTACEQCSQELRERVAELDTQLWQQAANYLEINNENTALKATIQRLEEERDNMLGGLEAYEQQVQRLERNSIDTADVFQSIIASLVKHGGLELLTLPDAVKHVCESNLANQQQVQRLEGKISAARVCEECDGTGLDLMNGPPGEELSEKCPACINGVVWPKEEG